MLPLSGPRASRKVFAYLSCVAVAALVLLAAFCAPPHDSLQLQRVDAFCAPPHDSLQLQRVESSAPPRQRALVTDVMFPNALAAWRLNSVAAMQDHFDADVLVIQRVEGYAFDWTTLVQSHRLHDYDLLIFNPAFNYLNWVNALNRSGEPFNGTAWNGRAPADYMLRLRKYGEECTVNVSAYAVHYHIFLWPYNLFARAFPEAAPNRSWIHFYPGGAYVWSPTGTWNFDVHPHVHLIVTQAFTRTHLARVLPHNPVLEAYGGPFVTEFARPLVRRALLASSKDVTVCFTSLGSVAEKGADHYVTIAEAYRERFGTAGGIEEKLQLQCDLNT